MSMISLASVVKETPISHESGSDWKASTFSSVSVPHAATSPTFTSWTPPAKSPAWLGQSDGGTVPRHDRVLRGAVEPGEVGGDPPVEELGVEAQLQLLAPLGTQRGVPEGAPAGPQDGLSARAGVRREEPRRREGVGLLPGRAHAARARNWLTQSRFQKASSCRTQVPLIFG